MQGPQALLDWCRAGGMKHGRPAFDVGHLRRATGIRGCGRPTFQFERGKFLAEFIGRAGVGDNRDEGYADKQHQNPRYLCSRRQLDGSPDRQDAAATHDPQRDQSNAAEQTNSGADLAHRVV